MKIWIKDPEAFEAGVILRFLYYLTGLENIELYISGLKKLDSFVRYSRVPIKVIKEKIKFEKPKGNFLVLDPDGKDIKEIDISKFDGIVVDFKKEIKGERIKGIGIEELHYEAIALFSKLFLKNPEVKFEVNQEINRDLIYLARKILEGLVFLDNFYIISPRLIVYSLRHIHKKYGILVDLIGTIISIKDNLEEEIRIKFYDKKLNKIKDSYILLKDNILDFPILKNKKERRYKFYIDFDRRRVYLSKDFWIGETEEKEDLLKYFFID